MKRYLFAFLILGFHHAYATAQIEDLSKLSEAQKSMILISALTAKGDLYLLKTACNQGLDNGLSINKVKECMVHSYAYCGFPRSIRGLQTLMEVLDERYHKGIKDTLGFITSKIETTDKYQRGRHNLEKLSGASQNAAPKGYAVFSPEIDVMLKEHLFADLFDRDVLTYAERELVTISVIAAIGKAKPMPKSHLIISLYNGWTADQLRQFIDIMRPIIGRKEAKKLKGILNEVLNTKK